MIDTHTHLYLSKTDPSTLVQRALEAGVEGMVSISVDPDTAKTGLDLAQQFDSVYPTVGIHPLYHEAFDRVSEIEQLLKAHQDDFVAVGEIGLDYHYGETTKVRQAEVFRAQLELARTYNKPVVIHNRKSNEDLVRILADYRDLRTVVHCFNGGEDFVEALWHDQMYYSFTGMITYAKKGKTLRSVSKIPLERMMIETDMPYLVPKAYHGLENEPAFVVEVAKTIAEVKGVSLEKVIESSTNTARHFFNL